MELRVQISHARPLRGVVAVIGSSDATTDRPEPLRFIGWLELLCALRDLLTDQTAELEPGPDGQLGEDVRDVGLDRAP